MEKSKFGVCPLFTFEKIISGKWMLPVLRCLEQNDGIRFGALLRCFPEITKATLTKQLRRLEDVGHEFLHVFNKVEAWCEIYLADKAERKAHAAALAE